MVGHDGRVTGRPGSGDVADRDLADVERAVALAERLLAESQASTTRAERRRLRRLGRLVDDPLGRELTFRLTDDVLRIRDPRRAAQRFRDIVGSLGVPASLGRVDALLLRVGALVAPIAPRLVMPMVVERIRHESRGVVLPREDRRFARHAAHRRAQGVRLNVNVLGEAILSDAEAAARLASVRATLARDDVDYVSVKVSAICANLDPLAFEHSVRRVAEPLRTLYRDALRHSPPKFVNLDMEEYRDLALTVAAFTSVLDEPEFAGLDTGIVLQAYLPDAHAALDHLGTWAVARHVRGGGTTKIRLVKGANLAMELVDAETHGWNPAPYASKAEVDASYKALLERALDPSWAAAVRVGLASHNLFDVAWGLVVRDRLERPDRLEFEMLEGMAPAQARAVNAAADGLLLYAPVVAARDVDSSIAYLARRLDENTAPENFLRALFALQPGSVEFSQQAERFRSAVRDRHAVSTASRRAAPPAPTGGAAFENEADSDLTQPDVRAALVEVPPTVEVELTTSIGEVDAVLDRALSAGRRWATSPLDQRAALLGAVATVMAERRFESIALMADEAGKTVREADPEVSEAIDFARYYGTTGLDAVRAVGRDGCAVTGRGVVLVVAPWNFPHAIPAGGVCAALAAGNAVVLKPAPETRRIAKALVEQLWEAGVPRDLVQYIACDDDEIGRHLVTHSAIDTVILTGSFDTARLFLSWRPDLRLLAETSGKNALVITAAADLDAALRDLVRSAFGHAGQKCSAASLAIVEASVHDDPTFHRRLADAVESLIVGWPDDPATMMGPLIGPPRGALRRGLTELDEGETWLVEPRSIDDRTWTPGVRAGVAPGSWFHTTECFGPVLGVMRARDLDHAIELQNGTPYGLTGGIHSLDPAEVERWLDRVQVGNAYVNRHITGAVVQRQPFGGWKRSAIGGGAKAGGPDYVLNLCRVSTPPVLDVARAMRSIEGWWVTWFSVEHDPTGLASERNVLRYRPLTGVVLRVDTGTAAAAIEVARAAARRCGTPIEVSDASIESTESLLRRIDADAVPVERVRWLAAAPAPTADLADRAVSVETSPIHPDGRVELPRWLKEQSISETAHRYGRLVARTSGPTQ